MLGLGSWGLWSWASSLNITMEGNEIRLWLVLELEELGYMHSLIFFFF